MFRSNQVMIITGLYFLTFQYHLNGKHTTKCKIADLHYLCEYLWLTMKFDAHAEGVSKNTKEDGSLKYIVIDEIFQVLTKFTPATRY